MLKPACAPSEATVARSIPEGGREHGANGKAFPSILWLIRSDQFLFLDCCYSHGAHTTHADTAGYYVQSVMGRVGSAGLMKLIT